MARELKIPAKGRGRRGRRREEAGAGLAWKEGGLLGVGDVLDEVDAVGFVVVVVHALAGGSLALKVPPLRGAWLTPHVKTRAVVRQRDERAAVSISAEEVMSALVSCWGCRQEVREE